MADSAQTDAPQGPETLRERVQAVLAGHPAALEAWFRDEHGPVYRLCLGLLADADEAEDAAQDAMLHLHDRLDRWDPARDYAAWRNTVVANLCRDRQRRAGVRRRAEARAAERNLPPELPDPALDVEGEDTRAALVASLAHLSPREREVFVLRDLEEHTTREVAAVLGITEGAVRSLAMLARRRLRELLGARVGLAAEGEA